MKNLEAIIDESTKLELKAYELYLLFAKTNCEDKKFWTKIAKEERDHARLLQATKLFLTIGDEKFPHDIVVEDINFIKECNLSILKDFELFNKNPKRETAFQIAIKNENSIGESHYRKFMKKVNNDKLSNIFRILNGCEVDHHRLLCNYVKKNKISI